MKTKSCKTCQQRKAVTEFYKAKKNRDGLQYQCRACALKRRNAENAKHKAEGRMTHSQRTRQRLRLEVLTHYSDGDIKCKCCGERHTEFMAIDHIEGGGNRHRQEIGRSGLYSWLKRNNFPPGFRVLCHNCNQAIGTLGYCPHHTLGPVDVPPEQRRKPRAAVLTDLREAVRFLLRTRQRVTLKNVGSLCNLSPSAVCEYKPQLLKEKVWPRKKTTKRPAATTTRSRRAWASRGD